MREVGALVATIPQFWPIFEVLLFRSQIQYLAVKGIKR